MSGDGMRGHDGRGAARQVAARAMPAQPAPATTPATRRRRTLALLLASVGLTGQALSGVSVEQARAWFEQHIGKRQHEDPTVVADYADDARILVRRIEADGATRELPLTGVQWKALITAALGHDSIDEDSDGFDNIRYEAVGHEVLVRARRHSRSRCFVDEDYSARLGRQPDGVVRIVAESATSVAQGRCTRAAGGGDR